MERTKQNEPVDEGAVNFFRIWLFHFPTKPFPGSTLSGWQLRGGTLINREGNGPLNKPGEWADPALKRPSTTTRFHRDRAHNVTVYLRDALKFKIESQKCKARQCIHCNTITTNKNREATVSYALRH